MTALEAATAALARRDRAGADLVEYLERKGYDADEARTAVERLRAAGYVDDARYAAARAEALAARGYGDAWIDAELRRQGVGAAEAEAALASLEPEADRLAAIVARDGASPRTGRRLVGKGFAPEAVEEGLGDAG
ncbi:MAG: RecX family transcriptional regulator [Actinobacteria bacterium]|nr:RecX family transcriptional regulator [Actinomycetota bacterium]MBV8598002.1 RecX family transcriptional regulator [Actinomycetota bacterium]